MEVFFGIWKKSGFSGTTGPNQKNWSFFEKVRNVIEHLYSELHKNVNRSTHMEFKMMAEMKFINEQEPYDNWARWANLTQV